MQILFKDCSLREKLTSKKKCRHSSVWWHLYINFPIVPLQAAVSSPLSCHFLCFPAILIHTCHRDFAHEGSSWLFHEGSIIHLHLCSFKVTVFRKLTFSINWAQTQETQELMCLRVEVILSSISQQSYEKVSGADFWKVNFFLRL